MDKHFVSILYSAKINKYDIGCLKNPDERLVFHNSALNRIWTQRGQPWLMKKTIGFSTKTEALSAERKIKKLRSRKVIEGIIKNGWRD